MIASTVIALGLISGRPPRRSIVAMTASNRAGARWRGYQTSSWPERYGAITLGSRRMETDDGAIVWRPLTGRPLTITVWAVWRSRPRDPALRALVKTLRKATAHGPLTGA